MGEQLKTGSDCFSCALARRDDEPLLFKGGDLSRTGTIPALA